MKATATRQPLAHAEATTLGKALEALQDMGVAARTTRPGGKNANAHVDAWLRLRYGKAEWQGPVEIKHAVTPANIGLIAHQFEGLPEKPILVTDYVTPPMARRLRELGIFFADAAGNAYIQAPPLLLWVTGCKPEVRPRTARATRAFQPGGLRIVFALLCKPDLANAPYRELADAAGVALGTVGWVLRDLREEGYLVDLGKRGRRLAERRRLLDAWVDAYARHLRPKLLLGRYRANWPDWWTGARLEIFGARWGGETAAAKLTGYLKPAMGTVYLADDPKLIARFVVEFKLLKDPDGDVELRQTFWRFDAPHPLLLAPPLLVYADLLATGDDRNREAARMIYDQHLARLVEPA